MAYTKYNADWKNYPDVTTPITEAALDWIENGIVATAVVADAAAVRAGYSTTLPGSPINGQEHILVDSITAPTYSWHLRYNSTLAKWEYIGGRPAFSAVDTSESTASTTYVALATAGPSIVLPVAGDYDVQIGCCTRDAVSNNVFGYMSYDVGATGASDSDSIFNGSPTTGSYITSSNHRRKTGIGAVTLTAKYKVITAAIYFQARWMSVTPVKL